MIIAFALCRLLPPFDPEGEGYEKDTKDKGVASDDPDNGKGSLTGSRDDKQSEEY